MTQKTGTALKVGDVVRRAYGTVGPVAGVPRKLGAMEGVIIKVIDGGGSGARPKGKRGNAVVVRWSSGSEATHDACMIVKTSDPATSKHQARRVTPS
jgi:hypothetical protein